MRRKQKVTPHPVDLVVEAEPRGLLVIPIPIPIPPVVEVVVVSLPPRLPLYGEEETRRLRKMKQKLRVNLLLVGEELPVQPIPTLTKPKRVPMHPMYSVPPHHQTLKTQIRGVLPLGTRTKLQIKRRQTQRVEV